MKKIILGLTIILVSQVFSYQDATISMYLHRLKYGYALVVKGGYFATYFSDNYSDSLPFRINQSVINSYNVSKFQIPMKHDENENCEMREVQSIDSLFKLLKKVEVTFNDFTIYPGIIINHKIDDMVSLNFEGRFYRIFKNINLVYIVNNELVSSTSNKYVDYIKFGSIDGCIDGCIPSLKYIMKSGLNGLFADCDY